MNKIARKVFCRRKEIGSIWESFCRAKTIHRAFNPHSPSFLAEPFNNRFLFHRQFSSIAELSVPESAVKKLLNHLVDAHSNGSTTDFEDLIQFYPIKTLLDERITILENVESLKELESDPEVKKLAEEEKLSNQKRLAEIDDKLVDLVYNHIDVENHNDVILELTAGVGGQESMLFLKELMEMYIKYLGYLGYNFDILDLDQASQGGTRHGSLMISGQGCYQKLKHEAGVHRVQRVPATERSGRIHTSVVSVGVLPQPSEIEVYIDPKDIRVDVMRASGAGGQHVNVTNSACRITHLPTGTVAECQVHRSQLRNREMAMVKLRAKLYEQQMSIQTENFTSLRRQQMGLGLRHEKIRTYNYPQDRITDHRLKNGSLHNLKGFLEGGRLLEELHDRLSQDLRCKLLLEATKYL
ncbi:hypothetical protein TKK_0000703 [Trichogramma kaykai]